jgi:hypothetical protein
MTLILLPSSLCPTIFLRPITGWTAEAQELPYFGVQVELKKAVKVGIRSETMNLFVLPPKVRKYIHLLLLL